ncbi:TDT family transporter [Aspergillus ruber CBS 135680]|uniref:Sulfite efflux pump SSU1 n=1 Tax=Aspergillus ruber (strain CBS 135680) TaxID=1388766 RepID=A0A017S673_ASPRC|nr:malate permease [Aspergillus ruber CBS 135680]EYE92356.1 malate permease [Aspergillus ruber CBS 135680]
MVQNFTPSWFSVIMGTGIVSTLLNVLPYNGRWLRWISIVIFALNVFLFIAGCILSLIRYTMYPKTIRAVIFHPVQAMFLGAFPMGLSTIVNMFCLVCVPAWGTWAAEFALALWSLDAAISVLCALSLPFSLMLSNKDTHLSTMTAVWLMPIVTCVVASGTGGIVAQVLPDPDQAFGVIVASYILWGIGVPLSLMVFVIYFQRLTIHKLPPKETIVSVFLPMGPLGSGAFSALKLGLTAKETFPKSSFLFDKSIIPTMYAMGFMTALVFWAFGLVWLFFASASILRCKKFPFNIGWWGFTFPLGAYALATCQLGLEMYSSFFKVVGTMLSLCVVILWILVSVGTLRGTISGKLLVDPALAEMRDKQERKRLSAYLG